MPFLPASYQKISEELSAKQVTLVAVSKTKPNEDILEAYHAGVRDFGENYVQELLAKHESLPKDIRWHFIGHLQRNKVKYIAPFVYLVHGVDSRSLLVELNKQGAKINRRISCLLQVHIAKEETKFGLDENELTGIMDEIAASPENFSHVQVRGLMGMASFTADHEEVRREFAFLRQLFLQCKKRPGIDASFDTLSMGMSGDYPVALSEGSNMVRIGSLLFGERTYS